MEKTIRDLIANSTDITDRINEDEETQTGEQMSDDMTPPQEVDINSQVNVGVDDSERTPELAGIEKLQQDYIDAKKEAASKANLVRALQAGGNALSKMFGGNTVPVVDIKEEEPLKQKLAYQQALKDKLRKQKLESEGRYIKSYDKYLGKYVQKWVPKGEEATIGEKPKEQSRLDKLKEQELIYDIMGKKRKLEEKSEELTVGQKAVDKLFAKEYNDFILKGGFSDFAKQNKQLEDVVKGLKSGKYGTGWLSTVHIPGTESYNAKEAVAEVTQRNLKLILGGQFSEREGKQLIDRAYNPTAGEKENAKRVSRLVKQMQQAAKAKQEAIEYFEKNGTMRGFSGKVHKSALEFLNEDEYLDGKPKFLKKMNGYNYFRNSEGKIIKKKIDRVSLKERAAIGG